MKIKTQDLTDAALDWAVAYAQGRTPTLNMYSHGMVWHGWWLATGGEYERMPSYSTDWAQGGPLIEREGLLVRPQPGNGWDSWKHGADEPCYSIGPTPLIAVMRCYVSNCLGSEVEVPEELL